MPTKRGSGTNDNPIFRILIFLGWWIMAVSTDGLTEGNEIVDLFPSPEEKFASVMFNDAKKKTLMQRRTLRARRYNSKRYYYSMLALVENQREYSRNLEFSLSMSMSMGYYSSGSMSHSYSYNYSYSYGPRKRQLRNRNRKKDRVEINDGRRREMEKIIADITDPQFWE